jgi:DNA-binding PadR family transcriptional regulator
MSSKDRPSASDLTPLSPAVFHILLSLGEGERHGYALKREIAERTDSHLDDERRRYYRITSYGRKMAQAEAARMANWWSWRLQNSGSFAMPDARSPESRAPCSLGGSSRA